MRSQTWPGRNWCPDVDDIIELLNDSTIQSCDLLQSGSNYVFIVRLDAGARGEGLAVYKPYKGEAPLWDYPNGNLYRRELAAYLVSNALGWGFVPPTIIRDGPHGIGSVQLFIEHDPRQTFFSLRDTRVFEMQRMAAFDAAVNNGDRKGGHCLLGVDHRIWGIDHGLTFHSENKLRTVIWDFAGETLPEPLLGDLGRLYGQLEQAGELTLQLEQLITATEMGAFRRRLSRLVEERRYPAPSSRRPVPWPPV